jgi:hypothetical protein
VYVHDRYLYDTKIPDGFEAPELLLDSLLYYCYDF